MTTIKNEPAVGNYFVSAYPPFSCWTPEGLEAYRQVLARPTDETRRVALGLYVHIPFCVHRCQYCYYLAYDGRMKEMERYLAAATRELELYREMPALAGRDLSFVYFGGGTPSLLSVSRLREFLSGLQRVAPWDRVREATFECAPKSVTESKLEVLRQAGITRLSMGVQQLDDDVLARNGRVHEIDDVLRAYDSIRHVGFDVVNLDLIVGLVGETDESFERSLDRIIALGPDSVTIYLLEIPLNTPLYDALSSGATGVDPAQWPVKRKRLGRGFERLERAGYTVRSAYAAVRDPQSTPFVYQDEQYRGADLLGIGAASFSYIAGAHQQNQAGLTRYLNRLDDDELPLSRAYLLGRDEQLVREFVLQLKLGSVETASLGEKFGVDVVDRFADVLAHCRREGWLTIESDRVSLTRDGLLRVDRMIPEFYLPAHRGIRYS
jgi:oxygen-independent coproporphyrinogen-3 oxidase